jgi:hypothetical protein
VERWWPAAAEGEWAHSESPSPHHTTAVAGTGMKQGTRLAAALADIVVAMTEAPVTSSGVGIIRMWRKTMRCFATVKKKSAYLVRISFHFIFCIFYSP